VSVSEKHRRFVKIRRSDDSSINIVKDWGQQSPLHWAAYDGQIAIARLLIKNGADVSARDEYDATPLHFAAELGQAEVAQLLIENGADINAIDREQKTPMEWAAENGHVDVAKLLSNAVNAQSGHVNQVRRRLDCKQAIE
jgi:ankyrin repeat protein